MQAPLLLRFLTVLDLVLDPVRSSLFKLGPDYPQYAALSLLALTMVMEVLVGQQGECLGFSLQEEGRICSQGLAIEMHGQGETCTALVYSTY